jgi:outer membrane receptor protein involved in Fe transport
MHRPLRLHALILCTGSGLLIAALPLPAAAQNSGQTAASQKPPVVTQQVEVVATRLPEAPDDVPAPIEVLSGDDLRNRGATTLRDALTLAAGVDISPGGDAGPASAVPEFWGLHEFDAFLLVVDDIPWGGAFNPALTSLDLHDVERIEILRGAAPVTYGATSFVGVIHVVHKAAAATRSYVDARGGTLKTGGATVDLALPQAGAWASRLTLDVDRQGFADARTSYRRGHALFRTIKEGNGRRMWLTADLSVLRQSPASPHPVDENGLAPEVPLDANANPAGAFMNENRAEVAFGMQRSMGSLQWVTTASFARTAQQNFRGFLNTIEDVPDNATGLRQNINLTDLYVDSHFVWPAKAHVQLVAGGDYLHGKGNSVGAIFDYTTPLDGATAAVVPEPTTLDLGNEDRREFAGGYALANWTPTTRVTVSAGIRANVTFEERGGSPAEEAAAKAAGQKDHGVLTNRPSGSAAVMYGLWERGVNHVRLYANYRSTFKPAAFDFGLGNDVGGLDPDKTLLKPETAQSVDGGVKARMFDGRLDLDADLFRMDFNNLVTATTVNGLPALQNAGKTRFQGLELAADLHLPRSVYARATYSFHDATYVDFVKVVDAGPTQLAGKRFEMSARQMGAVGLVLAPARGVAASFTLKAVGSRYLDEINSVLAPAYAAVDVGIGYRFTAVELRVDVHNLGNRRDAAALSELGDGQVYQLAAREAVFTMSTHF